MRFWFGILSSLHVDADIPYLFFCNPQAFSSAFYLHSRFFSVHLDEIWVIPEMWLSTLAQGTLVRLLWGDPDLLLFMLRLSNFLALVPERLPWGSDSVSGTPLRQRRPCPGCEICAVSRRSQVWLVARSSSLALLYSTVKVQFLFFSLMLLIWISSWQSEFLKLFLLSIVQMRHGVLSVVLQLVSECWRPAWSSLS